MRPGAPTASDLKMDARFGLTMKNTAMSDSLRIFVKFEKNWDGLNYTNFRNLQAHLHASKKKK